MNTAVPGLDLAQDAAEIMQAQIASRMRARRIRCPLVSRTAPANLKAPTVRRRTARQ